MCSTLVPSRGLCRSFAYRTRHTQCVARLFLRVVINEMHFPLDNSVCRVETTCPLVRLDNSVAVPSKLMRCSFHSTAPSVESRQLVRSYKLWKVFFHLSCRHAFSTRQLCLSGRDNLSTCTTRQLSCRP